MSTLRRVRLYEFRRPATTEPFERRLVGEGLFHGWGTDVLEFETGACNYTVAIVEKPDGSVVTAMPKLIEFVEPAEVAR